MSRPPSVSDLKCETARFFERHWNQDKMTAPSPSWDCSPNIDAVNAIIKIEDIRSYDKSGCYALAKGDEVVYIGAATSRGGGIYPEHGICRRLQAHVLCRPPGTKRKEHKRVLRDGWSSVTRIWTIGFEKNQG